MDYDKKLDDAIVVVTLSGAAVVACLVLFLTI